MKKIPEDLKKQILLDKFYERCCLTKTSRNEAKIDWHHNLIYAGSQVNEKFCILPLRKDIHDNIVKYKELCNWIMVNRATEEELERYSKAVDYKKLKVKLNNKYGEYNQQRKLL